MAIFLPALYDGGAEHTMLNLAEGIARCGPAVDLVLAQVEGAYLERVSDAIRVVDLGKGRIRGRSRTLSRLPALVRYLRHEQPDALLSALTRANLVAVLARRLARRPRRVVVNVQNHESREAPAEPTRLARLAPLLSRYLYRMADTVVGVSQGVVDDLVQVVGVPKRLVKVVFNPSITPELRDKAIAPLDHAWFRKGEPPVILAVGRLSKQKNYEMLFHSFAQFRQSGSARLLILGEGPDRKKLEALVAQLGIEHDVSLPGFVDNPFPYMVRAAVYVLSSLWEGLPTVLTEALYCGPPIVATDCPSGPREILRNGELGRLVPVGDATALADAIGAALDGKVPRPPLESWQPYTIETIADEYIELLLGDHE